MPRSKKGRLVDNLQTNAVLLLALALAVPRPYGATTAHRAFD